MIDTIKKRISETTTHNTQVVIGRIVFMQIKNLKMIKVEGWTRTSSNDHIEVQIDVYE
jgi:hypothetical protein